MYLFITFCRFFFHLHTYLVSRVRTGLVIVRNIWRPGVYEPKDTFLIPRFLFTLSMFFSVSPLSSPFLACHYLSCSLSLTLSSRSFLTDENLRSGHLFSNRLTDFTYRARIISFLLLFVTINCYC